MSNTGVDILAAADVELIQVLDRDGRALGRARMTFKVPIIVEGVAVEIRLKLRGHRELVMNEDSGRSFLPREVFVKDHVTLTEIPRGGLQPEDGR